MNYGNIISVTIRFQGIESASQKATLKHRITIKFFCIIYGLPSNITGTKII
jgi:hypothetical protein